MASLISIGTDSEIFAQDHSGKAISLCGKIGGTKEEPKPMKLGRGFFVQEDNVSVEFNIPPANTITQWDLYIDKALEEVGLMLKKMSLYFSENAAISFDKDQLIHPNALIFGCEPDFNAWTKTENEKPYCEDASLRTAGGHVHVGTRGNMIQGVEMMDLYLGVPSVILDDSPASINRRKLYGKAGAMRPKPYGFEYRVLSNFWIFSSEMRRWVYRNTALAVAREARVSPEDSSRIVRCINEGNKELAMELIKENSIPMPSDAAEVRPTIKASPLHGWADIEFIMNGIQDTATVHTQHGNGNG